MILIVIWMALLLNSILPILPVQATWQDSWKVSDHVMGKFINDPFHAHQKGQQHFTDYVYNPHVPIELWMELKPYFLPIDHPIKKKLDNIFQKRRATLSEETFVEAGFHMTRRNRPINAVVTGHKKLKGYLVKVYLDSQFAIQEWQMWLKRIKGVEIIQACIEKHGFTQFALPRKWIYPLPAEPFPPTDEQYHRKNFILVVEDMHILNYQKNLETYKEKMTIHLLNALYTVMMECQLTDCVYIGNMPFTKSGHIAFVDTELYLNGIPDFNRLKKYLSIPMQEHLDVLMQEENEWHSIKSYNAVCDHSTPRL